VLFILVFRSDHSDTGLCIYDGSEFDECPLFAEKFSQSVKRCAAWEIRLEHTIN